MNDITAILKLLFNAINKYILALPFQLLIFFWDCFIASRRTLCKIPLKVDAIYHLKTAQIISQSYRFCVVRWLYPYYFCTRLEIKSETIVLVITKDSNLVYYLKTAQLIAIFPLLICVFNSTIHIYKYMQIGGALV